VIVVMIVENKNCVLLINPFFPDRSIDGVTHNILYILYSILRRKRKREPLPYYYDTKLCDCAC